MSVREARTLAASAGRGSKESTLEMEPRLEGVVEALIGQGLQVGDYGFSFFAIGYTEGHVGVGDHGVRVG
jgi:hypothetical protein